jgi:transposase-like protein
MRTFTKTERPRYSAGERQRLVAAWRGSGQTQAAFAQEHEIGLGTFRQWLYRGERPKARSRKVAFREVTHRGQALELLMSPAVEIAVGPEITVRLKGACDPEVIAQLVGRLRRPC